jgi:tetratricopeptide (TPR) repeat protein
MATPPPRVGHGWLSLATLCTVLPMAGCAALAPSADPAPILPAAPAVAVAANPTTPAPAAAASGPAWPPPAFPMPSAGEVAAYAQQQRLAARQAAAQGQHAQAQRSWDILLALQPADAEAQAGYAQTSAALRTSAAERLTRARAAQARSDTDGAVRYYLEALALEPDNTAATDALRTLEHQRAQRNKPLSFARAPAMTGSSIETGLVPKRASSGSAKGLVPVAESSAGLAVGSQAAELEHAALLAAQGDLDAAITLLTPLLQPESGSGSGSRSGSGSGVGAGAKTPAAAKPSGAAAATAGTKAAAPPAKNGGTDAAIRSSLADYHCMLAERWASSDPKAARGALARCLRLASEHPAGKGLSAKLGAQ